VVSAAFAVGVLVAGGVFLLLRPGPVRVVFGFVLLGHAVNVLLVASEGLRRREAPLLGRGDPARMADPLPHAFVLTAIVITFGVTVLLLSLVHDGEPREGRPREGRPREGKPRGAKPGDGEPR
jgi:multicomponent Na+:H+ antiporter subunit C